MTLRIPESYIGVARPSLQLFDTSADYELKRLRKGAEWKIAQLSAELGDATAGRQAYAAQERALLARRERSMLFQDELGAWTYSGLASQLSERLGLPVERQYELPKPRPVPWAKTPQQFFGGPLKEHQIYGVAQLLQHGHGTCDYATGVGKTGLIANFLRELGLRSAVVVHSRVIADQLCGVLTALLGAKLVGQYNGDKKQLGKLFTVATSGALKNLRPGSKEWQWFSECQGYVVDESHICAADVLCALSTTLFRKAPFRLFTSATQTRGDGLELLLRGIVGPTLAELTFRRAVELDLLARPSFAMVNLDSDVNFWSGDPDRMTRKHLYESPKVAAAVGRLVRHFSGSGYACLVLAEEFPQVACLLEQLQGDDVAVLHGGTGGYKVAVNLWNGPTIKASPSTYCTTDRGRMELDSILLTPKEKRPSKLFVPQENADDREFDVADVKMVDVSGQALLPREYWGAETEEVRRQFNSLEKKIVVSTSAGRVGVDLCPEKPMALFYLAGGSSETSFVQGVGRGSRRRGKDHFFVFDFRVRNVEVLNRHADRRSDIAAELYDRPVEVELSDLLG